MHTLQSGSPLLSDAGLYSLACCFYNLPTLKIKPLLLPSPGLRRFSWPPSPLAAWITPGSPLVRCSLILLAWAWVLASAVAPSPLVTPCTIWSSFLQLTGISSSGSRNAFGSGGSSSAVMQENNVTNHSGFWVPSLKAIVYGQTPDTEGSGLGM